MKTVKEHVGEAIKIRRKSAKISQEELGFLIGLTRMSIMNIETGRSSTTLEGFLNICFILKCTPNDLLPLDHEFISPGDFKAKKLADKIDHLEAKLKSLKNKAV